jgi:catechol 2,3-dioxygenase-like lactoylglutathione lyase family enzyme
VRVTGLMFVGTRTGARAEMADFVRTVLGLAPAHVTGVDADLFELPDGSSFAVTEADDVPGARTVGFSVEDLEAATDELRAAGVDVDDEIAANERFRYVHFRAPDGRLYELVEISSG